MRQNPRHPLQYGGAESLKGGSSWRIATLTLETVEKEFELELVERAGIFAKIEPVGLSAELTNVLARNVPLATTINTEKADQR